MLQLIKDNINTKNIKMALILIASVLTFATVITYVYTPSSIAGVILMQIIMLLPAEIYYIKYFSKEK